MSVSTDGHISFGVLFSTGTEFSWGDGSEESWWRELCGYKPSKEIDWKRVCSPEGELPSDKAEIEAHLEEQRKFDVARPVPFKTVNYCHLEHPMYILAVPGTVKRCRRGHPLVFDPAVLVVPAGGTEKLLAFCAGQGLVFEDGPKWWLSSYWG